MDRLFDTKTLVLTLNLVEDGAKLAGEGALNSWKQTFGSTKFYSDLIPLVEQAIKTALSGPMATAQAEMKPITETGQLPQQIKEAIRNALIDDLHNRTTAEYQALKNSDLYKKLEKNLDSLAEEFDKSPSGVWLDPESRTALIVVSVLTISASYAIYSLRSKIPATPFNTREFSKINLSDKIKLGDVDLSGKLSNINLPERSFSLDTEISKKFEKIQLGASDTRKIDLLTGRTGSAIQEVFVRYQVPQGINAGAAVHHDEDSNETSLNIKFEFKKDGFKIDCAITVTQQRSAACSAELKFN